MSASARPLEAFLSRPGPLRLFLAAKRGDKTAEAELRRLLGLAGYIKDGTGALAGILNNLRGLQQLLKDRPLLKGIGGTKHSR